MQTEGPAESKRDGLTFIYRNWRGELEERKVVSPILVFGFSSYHPLPGEQWFLEAWDVHRGEMRSFRLDDILTPLRSS